jgi:hypothetical protein
VESWRVEEESQRPEPRSREHGGEELLPATVRADLMTWRRRGPGTGSWGGEPRVRDEDDEKWLRVAAAGGGDDEMGWGREGEGLGLGLGEGGVVRLLI